MEIISYKEILRLRIYFLFIINENFVTQVFNVSTFLLIEIDKNISDWITEIIQNLNQINWLYYVHLANRKIILIHRKIRDIFVTLYIITGNFDDHRMFDRLNYSNKICDYVFQVFVHTLHPYQINVSQNVLKTHQNGFRSRFFDLLSNDYDVLCKCISRSICRRINLSKRNGGLFPGPPYSQLL